MKEIRKISGDEVVEKIALTINNEEEILVFDKEKNIGKVSTKQLSKKALQEKTLRFRVKEAMDTKINDEKLPSLRELFFNSHLLIYGKDAHEVKGTGYNCPVCGLEIDEYGYCGCGSGSA